MKIGREKHATVPVRHPGEDWEVPIDQDIAPMVAALWALGLETGCSCQNDRGAVLVEMPFEDAQAFLAVVAKRASPEAARGAAMAGGGDPGAWKLEVFSQEILCHMPDEALPDSFDAVALIVSVRFPRRHLAEVTKALATAPRRRRANGRRPS